MIVFQSPAVLTVSSVMSGNVDVHATTTDRCVPGILYVSGDPKLLDAAYHRHTVQLELFGLTFRARVMGLEKGTTGYLLIDATSLYRALTKHLTLARRLAQGGYR